jgi:hypothetical protein
MKVIKMELKKIFDDCRIVGLAGDKHSGKTNNLVSLIIEYREQKKDVPIYAYGMPLEVMKFLVKLGVEEISSLKQMVNKKDCLLICDEFQKLKLNDRRYKDQLAEFVDFIYHRNVYVIFSSPNIREFNSVIGGIIERWLLKSVRIDSCVNGSQLKEVIDEYKGKYKSLGCIYVPKNEILLINDDKETIIKCKYIQKADTKRRIKELF